MLETERLPHALLREAESGVQADGRGVAGIADHGDHLPLAEPFAGLDYRAQQGAADAASDDVRRDVDAILHRMAVGGAEPEGGGIGKADDAVLQGGDEVRQSRVPHRRQTGAHLDGGRRLLLEGAEAVEDVVAIDRGDGGGVRRRGVTDVHAVRPKHS
jgi:hypothetical protein